MPRYTVPPDYMIQEGVRDGTDPDIHRRLVRIETRLSKLMNHLGIGVDGKPLRNAQSTHGHRAEFPDYSED